MMRSLSRRRNERHIASKTGDRPFASRPLRVQLPVPQHVARLAALP